MNGHVLRSWVRLCRWAHGQQCLASPSEVAVLGCVVSGAVLRTSRSLQALDKRRVPGRGPGE